MMISLDVKTGPAATVWRSNPCGTLYELAKRAPGQTAQVSVGDETILVVQDAASARHLLRTRPEVYDKHFGSFIYFFGESRLTSDGERWKTLQSISQPFIVATDQNRVAAAASRFFAVAAKSLLAEAKNNVPVSVDAALNRAAAAVIAEVTLGFEADQLSATLIEDFRSLLRYSSIMTWNLDGASWSEDEIARDAAMAAKARLRTGMTNLISNRRASGSSEKELFSTLAGNAEVDLLGEVCTLLFAGFDTTAATLSWALFLLAINPDLQEALRRQVIERSGDEELSTDDLEQLPDLIAFQNEVLRIFPAVPIISRIANSGDQLGEMKIAAGQKILVSIIGLHHDRRHFANPAAVDLARFPEGKMRSEDHGHYLPFGTGRRVCGGARVAGTELTAALVTLLKHIRVRFADVGPLLFDWDASMRRTGGQRLIVEAV